MVAFGAVALATAYPTGPKIDSGPRWESFVSADELQVGQPLRIAAARLWLVKLKSGEVLALSSKDPYRGCSLPWRSDFEFDGHKGWFRDSCYGSTYDIDGKKMFGPSPRNMDRFTVRVYGGDVQVMMGGGKPLPTPQPPGLPPLP
jgi:nitrite reductase/ring-hydroxylating ferredoxin subunit